MTPTANLQSRRHHRTCGHCGGPRDGHAWRINMPVCASCAALSGRLVKRGRCPTRCGPGGLVGPACRFLAGHPQPCAPAGSSRALHIILALQAARRAEAIHG
ncbi:MAG: hypothetical protein ACYC2H_10150 [Thermoplasmatota archaeon]